MRIKRICLIILLKGLKINEKEDNIKNRSKSHNNKFKRNSCLAIKIGNRQDKPTLLTLRIANLQLVLKAKIEPVLMRQLEVAKS